MIWLDDEDGVDGIGGSVADSYRLSDVADRYIAMTNRDTSESEVVFASFLVADVHPRYCALPHPTRVAQIALDLLAASPAVVAEVSWVVGEEIAFTEPENGKASGGEGW